MVSWREVAFLILDNCSIEGKEEMTVLCAAAAAAKSLQSCPTLRDPRDGSPPGSPVPEILQARTLEWVAISFSRQCYISTYQSPLFPYPSNKMATFGK